MDMFKDLVIGDIHEQTFDEIIHGRAYRDILERFARGEPPSLCADARKCGGRGSVTAPPDAQPPQTVIRKSVSTWMHRMNRIRQHNQNAFILSIHVQFLPLSPCPPCLCTSMSENCRKAR